MNIYCSILNIYAKAYWLLECISLLNIYLRATAPCFGKFLYEVFSSYEWQVYRIICSFNFVSIRVVGHAPDPCEMGNIFLVNTIHNLLLLQIPWREIFFCNFTKFIFAKREENKFYWSCCLLILNIKSSLAVVFES